MKLKNNLLDPDVRVQFMFVRSIESVNCQWPETSTSVTPTNHAYSGDPSVMFGKFSMFLFTLRSSLSTEQFLSGPGSAGAGFRSPTSPNPQMTKKKLDQKK